MHLEMPHFHYKMVSNSLEDKIQPSNATVFSIATNKTCFYCPSKLTSPQVCHDPLREATYNTIDFWRFQVHVNFLTTPNIVYRPSPCR